MYKWLPTTLFITLLVTGCLTVSAEQKIADGLNYDTTTNSPAPIPSAEQNLQTSVAVPWFKVSSEGHTLEGAIFDHDGNLLFCDVTSRHVLRLTPNKQLATIVTIKDFAPGGLALHKDGRLFIAALNLEKGLGTIVAVNVDGTNQQTIIPAKAGYLPNDLVFDQQGGFYFSDFKGTATEPKGGVYYVTPDFKTIKPVLPHLALANGVALSPNGKTLWATEFGRNLLHKIELTDSTTIAPIGSTIPYHFIGTAPDSMRLDADGNVWVALYGQGRILAFNNKGIPIGQVLLAGREHGHHLLSTSFAIHPTTNDLYSVTSDGESGQGATIFHTKVFTHGLPPTK